MIRTAVAAFLSFLIASAALAGENLQPVWCRYGSGRKPVLLIIGNTHGETITFSPEEFASLEQSRVEVTGEDGTKTTYEGVPVGKLSTLAGGILPDMAATPRTVFRCSLTAF